jgi:hypothetical protein
MANRSRRGGSAGRRYVWQRDTDDSTATIGESLEAPAGLQQNLNETSAHEMTDTNRRDYRCRIRRIIDFFENDGDQSCQQYIESGGVVDVSDDDQKDKTKYFFDGRYKKDLKYEGMNVKFLMYFMTKIKWKAGNKLKSIEDLRKYKDAVMWGAQTAGGYLPSKFYTEFENFLKGYKKEFTKAKKRGETDDTTCDPIPFSLYKLVLQWALEKNNVLVWFWTLAQWNCVARSASIDPLRFGNFKVGSDSIIAKYDESKADKDAERLAEKNIFANPFDWKLCFWTGLSIFISLKKENYQNNKNLFLGRRAKEGTASSNYLEQLVTILQRHEEEVNEHMLAHRLNAYSFRKGSATYAVSGTTVPPPLNAVARRGEWSVGHVLDCYWHFCQTGDQYLGRILCGLDPNSNDFDVLPPHWSIMNPMSNNDDVKNGMEMMYGRQFLDEHKDFVPILVRSLACFVYHSNDIKTEIF